MANPLKVSARTVILVEPEETVEEQLRSELVGGKFDVVSARDLNQIDRLLAERFSKIPPLAVLVDMVLPQSSGFDLVRRLCEKHGDKKLTIFILSKVLDPTDQAEANSSGAIGLIKKPFTRSEFEQALENVRMRRLKAEIGSIVFSIGS